MISRRQLLRSSVVVGLGFSSLRCALTRPRVDFDPGDLVRDPLGVLDLPRGFSYVPISLVGEIMNDGWVVPGAPDGMGAFPSPDGNVIVVRNHELSAGASDMGPFATRERELHEIDRAWLYDPGYGKTPGLGGTTTFVYDPLRGRIVHQFLSLAGTYRNCAGGITPWGSWISCEESVAERSAASEQDHGYCFEVPASARVPVEPRPLRALGRFNHEAVAIDPHSGVVYLTEDRGDSLFYRFVPEPRGQLERGRLEALVIRGKPAAETYNYPRRDLHFEPGEMIEVDWIPLDDIDAPGDDLRHRGFAQGAARFARGEGIWAADDHVYFACTNGGAARRGQIWRYWPSRREGTPKEIDRPGKLELFVEASDSPKLDHPDNITLTPWGELVVCEDGPGGDQLVRVQADGKLSLLARNVYDEGEITGSVFAPDGQTLFLNLQKSGLTLAIRGPWPKV